MSERWYTAPLTFGAIWLVISALLAWGLGWGLWGRHK